MCAVNICVFYFQLVDIGFGTIPDTRTAFMVSKMSKADLKFSDNVSAPSLILSKIDSIIFPDIYTRTESIINILHHTIYSRYVCIVWNCNSTNTICVLFSGQTKGIKHSASKQRESAQICMVTSSKTTYGVGR